MNLDSLLDWYGLLAKLRLAAAKSRRKGNIGNREAYHVQFERKEGTVHIEGVAYTVPRSAS